VHWLIKVIGRCRSSLEGILDKAPDAPKDAPEEVHLIRFSLRYACDTLDAITTELRAGRPLQAGVLVRTLFELALRIRLASLYDDGWRRLIAYWFEQYGKSLRAVNRGDLDAEATARVDKAREDYETFRREGRSPQPSNFKDVLDEVVKEIDGDRNAEWSKCLYNGYRDLCRYAHANMTVCGGGIPIACIGRVLLAHVAYATIQFVEASRSSFDFAVSDAQMNDLLDDLYRLPDLAMKCKWGSES